jgi:hypothetical protein
MSSEVGYALENASTRELTFSEMSITNRAGEK